MGTSYVFGRKKGENVCTRTVLPPLNSHRLRTQRWQIQKETIGTVIAKMTKDRNLFYKFKCYALTCGKC